MIFSRKAHYYIQVLCRQVMKGQRFVHRNNEQQKIKITMTHKSACRLLRVVNVNENSQVVHH